MNESKKEILIIDDEVDFRLLLAEVFVEQGYKVITARNGEEALELLRTVKTFPDLITVDVNMPVTDGMKFREEVLKMNPRAPIVMISGFLPPQPSALTGVRAYLTKPLDKLQLLSVLEQHRYYTSSDNL